MDVFWTRVGTARWGWRMPGVPLPLMHALTTCNALTMHALVQQAAALLLRTGPTPSSPCPPLPLQATVVAMEGAAARWQSKTEEIEQNLALVRFRCDEARSCPFFCPWADLLLLPLSCPALPPKQKLPFFCLVLTLCMAALFPSAGWLAIWLATWHYASLLHLTPVPPPSCLPACLARLQALRPSV